MEYEAAKALADAIHDLAGAIREFAAAQYLEQDMPSEIEQTLD